MGESRKVLFIECGTTLRSRVATGIQRVVRSILAEATQGRSDTFDQIVLVEYFEGRFFVVDAKGSRLPAVPSLRDFVWPWVYSVLCLFDYLLRRAGLQQIRSQIRDKLKSSVVKSRGDGLGIDSDSSDKFLLLLDSTWDTSIWMHTDKFRSAGGRVCAVLYDLIPFTHPDTTEEHTRVAHTGWWKEAHKHVDGVMCISRAVRDEYIKWLSKIDNKNLLRPENIGHFQLGSELAKNDPVIRVFGERSPCYLMVGSIEPRKNHARVLEAFESIWACGGDARLVIIGAFGWKSDGLVQLITSHREYQKRLHLIRDASDRDLAALYRLSNGLICASLAEGSGLPLIEALNYGADLMCSDIAVFHEILEDGATYFDPLSVASIAAAISNHMRQQLRWEDQKGFHPTCVFGWAESYAQLQLGVARCLTVEKTADGISL